MGAPSGREPLEDAYYASGGRASVASNSNNNLAALNSNRNYLDYKLTQALAQQLARLAPANVRLARQTY